MIFAGSYDLQGINVNSIMLSGTMEIDLHYLANSSTTGCLLILSQGQYTRYLAVRRPVGKDTQSVQLEGLPQGSYTISGYDVGKKRLSYDSVAMAAVTVRNITLEQRTAFWKQGTMHIFVYNNYAIETPKNPKNYSAPSASPFPNPVTFSSFTFSPVYM